MGVLRSKYIELMFVPVAEDRGRLNPWFPLDCAAKLSSAVNTSTLSRWQARDRESSLVIRVIWAAKCWNLKTGESREELETTSSQAGIQLDSPDVLSLKTLRPLHDVELDRLAFLKRAESLTLDG